MIDYETFLNDRLSKGITPATNSNVLIVRALGPRPDGVQLSHEYFKQLGIDSLPEDGKYYIEFRAYMTSRGVTGDQLDSRYAALSHVQQRPWRAEDYPRIAAWLEANQKPLALVMEASKRPHYYSPQLSERTETGRGALMAALLPTVQGSRELASALMARGMLLTAEGQYDAAWQDILACHRLARHIGSGPTLIDNLVGFALNHQASKATIALLASAHSRSDQLRSQALDLQRLKTIPHLGNTIDHSERILYLDGLQHMRRGGGFPGFNFTPDERKGLPLLDWEYISENSNKLYDRLASSLRLADRASRDKALEEIQNELEGSRRKLANEAKFAQEATNSKNPARYISKAVSDTHMSLLVSSLRKIQIARDMAEQTERNLHLAFALAANRTDTGRYPAKLDDLSPKYCDKVPDDFFAAKPLIYKPAEKGYLLYSVGPDGKDSGGRTREDDPPGDDLVVQMPLPAVKAKDR